MGLGLALLLALAASSAPLPDEVFEFTMPDGMVIRGIRYACPGCPVFAVDHGVLENTHTMRAFGSKLAGEPRVVDVWMFNKRGHGRGSHRSDFRVGRGSYSFDAMVVTDMDRVVDEILARTGAKKLSLIGHSMGGKVAKAWLRGAAGAGQRASRWDEDLARARSAKIAKLVTLGSPAHYRSMPWYVHGFVRGLSLARGASLGFALPAPGVEVAPTALDSVGAAKAAREAAWLPIDLFLPWVLPRGVLDLSQLSSNERARLREKGVSRVPLDLAKGDFVRWVRSGRFLSRAGLDYAEERPLEVPWLSIAGELDELALVADLREEARKLGAEFAVAHDTSHVNLVVGERSEVIADAIREWLLNDRPLGGRIEFPGEGCASGLRARLGVELRRR